MEHGKNQMMGGAHRWLVLVGNPNVGKSVIFGALTGRYATVSNYPGTTVEISRGSARLSHVTAGVIDSPGVNSLVPMSEDERVTRDILLDEEVGTVLQVLDAKNLRRGLLITMQLIEIGVPLTLCLNMYDEAGEKGIRIDLDSLSDAIGLNVFPTVATQRWNLEKIDDVFELNRSPASQIRYPPVVEEAVRELEAHLPETRIARRAVALMILSGDPTIKDWLKTRMAAEAASRVEEIRANAQSRLAEPIGYLVNRVRLKEADALVERAVTTESLTGGRIRNLVGTLSMHPVWGIPVLLVVLYVMYQFVGVVGAQISVDFFEKTIFGAYVNPWATRVVGLIFPSGFVHDLIVGPYGVITMALTYAIAIVLPIVGFFFIFFSLLEDSGYLPRLAIMVDTVFKLMGLNGKAVLPMVLGLGCDTMATMTTRILETKKERMIVTLLLALGVPCSAQVGVILGMLGAVSFTATVVWAFVVLMTMFVVGWLTAKALPGETSDFIIEIPPMRWPEMRNIALKTLVRVQWYLKEALPLFVLGTLTLFFLDKANILGTLEYLASPVVRGFLGLPVESTRAFIVGFLRRDYGAAGFLALQKKGMLDSVQVVVSLVTITLFIPCIANLFMIIKERGVKAAVYMTIFIFPFAFLVGGILNFALRLLHIGF